LRLNYDANRALTQIQTQVSSVRNQLPPQSQQPVLNVQVGETIDAMYMGFRRDVLPSNSITDYLARVVKPKLDAVQGVQTAEILGGRQFALRAWLDPARLAAHGVTAADVYQALGANNYLAAVGTTKGQMVSVDLTAGTDLHSVEEFKQLSIKQKGGAIVRLQMSRPSCSARKITTPTCPSAASWRSSSASRWPRMRTSSRSRSGCALPCRHPVAAAGWAVRRDRLRQHQVRQRIDSRGREDPDPGAADSHRGDLPVPGQRARGHHSGGRDALSLIGTFFVMLALGYSMNLLTLLALVLAIGLVVDDAIIVVRTSTGT